MQRSTSERLFQAVLYELIAIAFLTPVYSWAFDMPLDNSLATMAMTSLAVIIWAAIYNTIFDRGLRFLHATLLEVTITFIAVPIIMLMSGVSIWIALLADILFSLIFAVYTYVFYYIYDRLRPVRAPA